MHILLHTFKHTLLDGLKLFPFLFITFLLMEYIEHKFSKKNKEKLSNAGKFGPLFGGILGAFPQCGFSVMATNLYATRIISVGTLISIYLSTSDEMLPILISKGASFKLVFGIILIKLIIGITCGFIIDLILNNDNKNVEINDFCKKEHCHCNKNLILSSLKHTFNILIFVMIITFALNIGISKLGTERISKLFMKDTFFSPFISSLIGLIPNCGASVILTELFLNNVISLSSCIGGLLTGSGVALLVLFRVNKNIKQNIKIILTVYFIGAFSGVLFNIISLLF